MITLSADQSHDLKGSFVKGGYCYMLQHWFTDCWPCRSIFQHAYFHTHLILSFANLDIGLSCIFLFLTLNNPIKSIPISILSNYIFVWSSVQSLSSIAALTPLVHPVVYTAVEDLSLMCCTSCVVTPSAASLFFFSLHLSVVSDQTNYLYHI
jgi:hypothetical protein